MDIIPLYYDQRQNIWVAAEGGSNSHTRSIAGSDTMIDRIFISTSRSKDDIDLSRCIGEAIDEALGLFGNNARYQIYNLLEKRYALERKEIPVQLGNLSKGLSKLFGSASCSIELLIARYLSEKVGIEFQRLTDSSLEEYVKMLQSKLMEREMAKVTVSQPTNIEKTVTPTLS